MTTPTVAGETEWTLAEPAEEPSVLAVGDVVTTLFVRDGPVHWLGTAQCPHRLTRARIFSAGQADIDPTTWVQNLRANHRHLIHCACPFAPPTPNATVTFNPANAVSPGEVRLVPQSGGTLTSTNFALGGPPLACRTFGSYQLDLTASQAASTVAGAGGTLELRLDMRSIGSARFVDASGKATARINVMTNISPQTFITVAFTNTTPTVQDVPSASLSVGAVWVPPA